MTENVRVMHAMIDYFTGDPKRINHLIKVYSYAALICEMEDIDHKTKRLIEVTSLVHDIGIKKSEDKYGSASGRYQEIEGPAEAEVLLRQVGIEPLVIDRCCWLIAHHHTYDSIRDIDHQILVEADFLVNIYEDEMGQEAIEAVKKNIFRTGSGLTLLKDLYNT